MIFLRYSRLDKLITNLLDGFLVYGVRFVILVMIIISYVVFIVIELSISCDGEFIFLLSILINTLVMY